MKDSLLQTKSQWDSKIFSEEILSGIAQENLWNIWVPEKYGGLESSFSKGLKKLRELAKIDGSLGWTVTLCSGANYFIGNLKPTVANEIFLRNQTSVLGGSGGVFGNAEKVGDNYKISGIWRYATGAPYLTHFTLNAKIYDNSKPVLNKDGSTKVLSFIVPKKEVNIIEDWETMGLKASATYSFELKNVMIHKRFSFVYNEFYHPQDIFKIPFRVFADLTLWVNYLGMAEHFLEIAEKMKKVEALKYLKNSLKDYIQQSQEFSKTIEDKIGTEKNIDDKFIEILHNSASNSVKKISHYLIEVYPYLGINASKHGHPLNKIFCDYFTATQHHIFTK